MRGYVLAAKGQMEWRDGLKDPEPGEYGAVVRATAVATCVTDVHMMQTMAFPNLLDRALGHEMVGRVTAVGLKVRDFNVGDRVCVPAIVSEFRSLEAQDGLAKLADSSYFYNSDPDQHGMFAELHGVADADTTLAHIPEGVSDEQAVTVSDMGATAFEGVDLAEIEWGDSVVVLGVGPLGLTAVAACVLQGAGRIIGIGSRPKTFEIAREMGATDLVNYREGDVVEGVLAVNDGTPVDRVIIAGGDASNIAKALAMVKFGGIVVSMAGFLADAEAVIPMPDLGFGGTDKTLKTAKVHGGRRFAERVLTLIANKRYQPELIVSPVLHGFDSIEEGMDLLIDRDPETVKPVIYFD